MRPSDFSMTSPLVVSFARAASPSYAVGLNCGLYMPITSSRGARAASQRGKTSICCVQHAIFQKATTLIKTIRLALRAAGNTRGCNGGLGFIAPQGITAGREAAALPANFTKRPLSDAGRRPGKLCLPSQKEPFVEQENPAPVDAGNFISVTRNSFYGSTTANSLKPSKSLALYV